MKKQDAQCILYTYNVNIEARSRNHCCRVKAVRIAYYECVFVVLFIQNANLTRRHYNIFVNYLINGKKKKVIDHKMCVVVALQLLSETFLILRRI